MSVKADVRPLPPSLGDTSGGAVPHPVADWEAFVDFAAEQGDIFSFEVNGDPWLFVREPRDVADALKRPFDEIGIGPLVEALTQAGASGDSLVTNFSPSWRPRRAVVQRPLSFRSVQEFAAVMADLARERVTSWRSGEAIDVEAQMAALSLDVLVEALFSNDVGEAKPAILAFEHARQGDVVEMTKTPGALPQRSEHLQKMLNELDELVYAMIERRKGRPPEDLLGAVVHGRDDAGDPLPDETIRSEAVSLFFAGHSTTALSLTFAFVVLGSNYDYFKRLQQEVDEHLGKRLPDLNDLKSLWLARAIVEETLRLYPVSDLLDRRTVRETELGGFRVPGGTALIFSAWLPHRDERYFPAPLVFDPDRFSPDRRRSIPADAYFPFGDGPHVCVGNHFSLLESTTFLITLAQHCDFEILSNVPPRLSHHSLLHPTEPVLASIHSRGVG